MTSAEGSGAGLRCAVLGDPIAHSLSPVLHRAGYDALGLDLSYDAVQVPAGSLADFVGTLGPQWRGLSVTAPLKREALDFADVVTERATLAGGANTLLRTDDGWSADNTDLPGAVAAIRERYDGPLNSATIVGAGATAASVGLALGDLGVHTIRLLARDPARARETAAVLTRHPGLEVDVVAIEGAAMIGEIVVSTVPATAQTDLLVSAATDAAVVFEVVYDPWPTPLAAAAIQRGQALVTGLDLLVHQAVLQFSMFTGHNGPLAVMRAAGERALAAR